MPDKSSQESSQRNDNPGRSVFDDLSAIGVTLKLDSNRSIDLTRSVNAYFVVSGRLDVFAIRNPESDIVGPRLNILRVESGNLIFGINTDENISDAGFIGVAGTRTELLEMRFDDFCQLAADPEKKPDLANLIEEWVKALLASLCPGLGQKPVLFQDIKPGYQSQVTDREILGVRHGLLWASACDGSVRFMGRTDLENVSQGKNLPLCVKSWVSVEKCSVSAKATVELLETADAVSVTLSDFHALLIAIVRLQYDRIISQQTRILIQEKDQEKRLVESAFQTLSSTIIKGHRDFGEIKGRPLLDACCIVGAHIGIKFTQRQDDDQEGLGDPLKDLCEASRVRLREVVLIDDWWNRDHGSLLGFMNDDDRPVAILCIKPGSYLLCDPQVSSRVRIDRELAAGIKPLAYSFQVPFPEQPLNAWDLTKFAVKGLAPDIWRNVGFGLLVGLLGLLAPIATGILIDDIIPSENRSQLLGLSAALFVAAVCIMLFQFGQAIAILRIGGKSSFLVQSAVWDRLLALPVTFFRQYPAGDLANRTLGIDQMQQLISNQAMSTLMATFFSVFQIGLLFYYSIELALVGLILTVISLIVPVICLILQLKYQRPLYNLIGKIQAFNLQVINGMAKLRVTAAEKRIFNLWARMFSQQKELAYKSGMVGVVLGVSVGSLTLAGTFVIFTWTFFSSDKSLHAMPAGQFMAFVSALSGFLGSAYSTLTTLFPMMQVKPVYERTKPILQALPEVKHTAAFPGELAGHIEISQVSFRYTPTGPAIIKNFSLEIMPREFVALVGPSGSGKSTLLRLLLGFEQPESGAILYDGRDLAKLDVKAVRRQIGVVLQNGVLFSGSIFENIVGSSPITLNEAWEAVRMAQLEEDVKNMPMGMNTVIGEGGEGLSGGQRQRLLIARAVVRHPRILFFDEATSALDNESQELVSQSIEKLEAARLVLAHRLSTIKNAHKICVVVDGELAELGNYDELMSKGGVFADLAKRQIV